jgi:predicted phosphodiesterase
VKIRIHSDLHLEFLDWAPPAVDADVVVLAGDIHKGARGIEWARRRFPNSPVIYVPGNHEFYGGELHDVLTALRNQARRFDVELLDGMQLDLGGVRFLGATLWTDFALFGSTPTELARAMTDARFLVNDFRLIRYGERGLLSPQQVREIHLEQLKWLQSRLAESFAGPSVVVTHHLPHPGSIRPKYDADRLNAAFASDLSHVVGPPISLWIHGHTHDSCDYVANGTRVICNPRGYLPQEPNPDFDPCLCVELAPLSGSCSQSQSSGRDVISSPPEWHARGAPEPLHIDRTASEGDTSVSRSTNRAPA